MGERASNGTLNALLKKHQIRPLGLLKGNEGLSRCTGKPTKAPRSGARERAAVGGKERRRLATAQEGKPATNVIAPQKKRRGG